MSYLYNGQSAFDLTNMLNTAQQEVANNSDKKSSGEFDYKLVYPQNGTLRFKALFNPKAGVLMRKIERHDVDGTKKACLSPYGEDCKTCKVLDSIENQKGLKFRRKSRGFMYAQYIGSDYHWDNLDRKPEPGEVILLMFPWSIYMDINRIINDAGTRAAEIVATNQGRVMKIKRWVEKNSQVKYKAEIDVFADPYKSCETDEEFVKLLNDLPDLNEVTDQMIK